jgi:galactokinase
MNCNQALKKLQKGTLDACLCALYGKEALSAQHARYAQAIRAFAARFGEEREITLFSVSGRSELSGNHTDHNAGIALAAAVDLDVIAVASPTKTRTVTLLSDGYGEDTVDLDAFRAPRPDRYAHSDSLIAGLAQGLVGAGFAAGGFDAYTTSGVPKGSGLSSSAAFEILVGTIQNRFYNEGRIDAITLAQIAKFAENEFFGKPCGLLDQLAIATGGICALDFADPASPVVQKVDFDMTGSGFSLCIVNTGGNHADLTADYAAVPAEMKAVANALGGDVLRRVDERALLTDFTRLREEVGDRALLRAFHFFSENHRVREQVAALAAGDLDTFFDKVWESGRSSFQYLQNVYSPHAPKEQGLSLALCLAERFLQGKRGACRVHGGGFAGTIQVFLPTEHTPALCDLMDRAFGAGACTALHIRAQGPTVIE